jgi:galactose mutarotase-like enzyme
MIDVIWPDFVAPHAIDLKRYFKVEKITQYFQWAGSFLCGTLKGIGASYDRRGAFTLEAQYVPDLSNHANFPSTELKAGAKYSQTTIYKFLPL